MESLKTDLQALVIGKGLSTEKVIVDNDDIRGDFIPLTKRTVGYIVCAVLFNDDGDILMIQEAKSSCYGKWYIPAGRMEPNETINIAVQREVKEETGLLFQPTSLLSVEACNLWYRFCLLGNVVGGTLKTLNQKDAESLQARWWPVRAVLSTDDQDFVLRSSDILALIKLAQMYNSGSLCRHHVVLPAEVSHKHLLVRLVLLHAVLERNNIQMLIGLRNHIHLPTAIMSDIKQTVMHLIQDIFRSSFHLLQINFHGILSVEYDGRPKHLNDGVCFTLLVSVCNNEDKLLIEDDRNYIWQHVDHSLKNKLLELMETNALPPLLSA